MSHDPCGPVPLAELLARGVPRHAGAAPCGARGVESALTTGIGTSIAQHGELLQGQIEDHGRRRRRFLISLPCERLYSKVTFVPARGGEIAVVPAHKTKVCKVVELTLGRLDFAHLGGVLTVESNIEEGKGYGSSTADCIAGALAAANAVGRCLGEEELAKLVVAAEIASDNFMFSRAVLFAHREGVVLEDLGPRLPSVEVLGFDTHVDGAVYTLEFPPAAYGWRQIQSFHTLIAAARRAVRHHDVTLLGRVATSSALINQEFLPKPMFAELRDLARCVQAVGIAVAHSGTVLSLLFDPLDCGLEARLQQARKDLETLGIVRVLRFRT